MLKVLFTILAVVAIHAPPKTKLEQRDEMINNHPAVRKAVANVDKAVEDARAAGNTQDAQQAHDRVGEMIRARYRARQVAIQELGVQNPAFAQLDQQCRAEHDNLA